MSAPQPDQFRVGQRIRVRKHSGSSTETKIVLRLGPYSYRLADNTIAAASLLEAVDPKEA